jgi:DNA-binding response OmpR family regulator
MPKRMLVIDPDANTLGLLRGLAGPGVVVIGEARTDGALRRLQRESFDIVVLELQVVDRDGLEFCKALTSRFAMPVLVHTHRADTRQHLLALEHGADDFLAKPQDAQVLFAHILALHRRCVRQAGAAPAQAGQLVVGRLHLSRHSRQARYADKPLALTSTEFDLLYVLASAHGTPVTRESILNALHQHQHPGVSRAIDSRVWRLRAKLTAAGAPKDMLQASRSIGYVFAVTDAGAASSMALDG